METTTTGADTPKATPIVKWAGGKGKLVKQLKSMLPDDWKKLRYVEPFFGGGAMYFALQPERAVLNDINSDLVEMYGAVRSDATTVVGILRDLANHHSKEHYYQIRDAFNGIVRPGEEPVAATKQHRAAWFIYLNKTCFNGLWRVNASGHFNVPMGDYKNPTICDAENIIAASKQLQGAQFMSHDFNFVMHGVQAGDFVYLDPPYAGSADTESFAGYTRGGFDVADQTRLRDSIRNLTQWGVKIMLSNSDVPLIRHLYGRGDFRITEVQASRSISSDGGGRGSVTELVIRNY